MAATVIHSADVLNFNPVPDPQSVSAGNGAANPWDVLTLAYPRVGEMRFRNFLFPHVHVMNLHWVSDDDVVLHDSSPVDTVNINFQLSGNLDTTFEGLGRDLNMRPGRHNLVFSPEGGDTNRVAAGDRLEMFHISLDKAYFSHILGCDDRWSERVQENLLFNRPFAGMPGTGPNTAQMQALIREVKQCQFTGSMRNLIVQSKVLELLALQIGQFRGVEEKVTAVSTGDADKLHHLKHFLDAHFLEEHSLAELSRICLLNEFKVKKGFKELFGTTVFGYLRGLRMRYAEQLLLDSSRSIEEVSELLGYEHAQHFSIAFKKFRGVNPSSIRASRMSA
ncbi:AraC family transcriptional regulator [Dyadobacter beijingensis]|uniref:AraC family transcriptional regulator n=1 Tax=Dyadobacter beijingensis TaxID=365489 RepID=A0ABQ2HXF1_9BACT|nr:AraC family transcriptional regulator [Dyadobacter beijingensis]GGM92602.1 AraC family transcriptional regulator [Dyadobacter beijingensis]